MIERYTRSEYGFVELELTVHDPKVYRKPWSSRQKIRARTTSWPQPVLVNVRISQPPPDGLLLAITFLTAARRVGAGSNLVDLAPPTLAYGGRCRALESPTALESPHSAHPSGNSAISRMQPARPKTSARITACVALTMCRSMVADAVGTFQRIAGPPTVPGIINAE